MRKMITNMTPLKYFLVIAFLFARAAMMMGDLLGDNVCHRRETYTVTMRVIVKEPIQVKSYTWCLKVPPRCTKYKIEMRDKFKIQTELRERIVDVCCAGYAADRTETHCLPVCAGCVHGVCATPHTCTCEPGYAGDRCEIECQDGLWGADCQNKCQCQNEAECHHVTGDCKCGDGWRGTVCDTPCPRGTYGQSCIKECSCGYSSENTTCHHVTGECLSPQNTITPNLQTTLIPPPTTTTLKPQEMPENVSTLDNETDHLYGVTQIGNTTTRTTVNDSDFFTVLPTRTSVRVTENVPLPNTEKHVLYPEKFTTVAPETTNVLVTPTTEGTISTTAPEVKEVAETTISSEVQSSITAAITDIVHTTAVSNTVLFYPKDLEKTTMQNDIDDNSMMKPSEIDQTEESDDVETVLTKEYTPVPTESIENTLHTKDEATTMPQNFQIPPNGIFVVSDGLLSDRTDVEEGVGERKDAKDSFWDLVSSVSVAGGVALALIVMAAITVLVSQRRNRKKVSIAESKRSSQRRREADQLPPPPAPQMYNYTDDVTTLPLRNLFPDATYQPSGVRSGSECLQLRFGDITTTTNNNIGQPYNDMRAYLELQYDIPPSAMNSKTNSFQPVPENNTQLGSEPEHLYDEIPCWRSNRTTSTNTDTDTSRC